MAFIDARSRSRNEVIVKLPTLFHEPAKFEPPGLVTDLMEEWPTIPGVGPRSQVAAYRAFQQCRYLVVRCGRRWGKTKFAATIVADAAIKGQFAGWFAPSYKILSEAYNDIKDILMPVLSHHSKMEGVLRTLTDGRVDFWTLEDERAGRSRFYDVVVLDEAAFAKAMTFRTWQNSIRPTLTDRRGKALVISNTNGIDEDNFFYALCHEDALGLKLGGFRQFHATAYDNPFLPEAELRELEDKFPPQEHEQEHLARFIDWGGLQFFQRDKLLVDGRAIEYPDPNGRSVCEAVFATIDTAVKDRPEHDGTAVSFWAVARHGISPFPLVVLDWDVTQIEGALLENWLPNVYVRLEELARTTRARRGSLGAFIEDKASGSILIQQAKRRGLAVHAIDGALTAAGKDGRAMSVSGYIHREMVKFSEYAYNKVVIYKKRSRNHLFSQVVGYRVGASKEGNEDDLLDTFCYGVAIALGNSQGF